MPPVGHDGLVSSTCALWSPRHTVEREVPKMDVYINKGAHECILGFSIVLHLAVIQP